MLKEFIKAIKNDICVYAIHTALTTTVMALVMHWLKI